MRLTWKPLLSVALAGAAVAAASGPGEPLNFVACPVLRDTTPNCWTALHDGETYFIGAQRGPSDSYLPQMKHQVLVEGVVTGEPRVCGGIVLKPLRVSVLPELDLSCDGPVLPGEGLTPPTVPPRNNSPRSAPPSEALGPVGSFMRTPVPQPPFTTREFDIQFDFGTDILTDQMQRRVIEILTYAATAKASALVIRGYSSSTPLADGKRLTEPVGLGEQRAKKVAEMFANLGVPRGTTRVEWTEAGADPAAILGAARRLVSVTVTP